MSGIGAQFRGSVAAFAFLTRIPVTHIVEHDVEDLTRAAPYFPVVGAVVAACGSAVLYGALQVWTPLIAVILSMGATVLITGAFHEDALADSLDGFGGGWNAEQVLAIMKDSRVGSYALVGMILVLAVKAAALLAILDAGLIGGVTRALIAAHVAGRWSSLVLIRLHKYVRLDAQGIAAGIGTPFVGAVTPPQLFAGTVFALAIVAGAMGMTVLPVMAVALVVTLVSGRYFMHRIGGVTGDALGAANQLVELSVYLLLAGHW
jgi:adenosylcobinamide-GDP ribazoletransferase